MQSASLALPVARVEALPPSRLLHCVQAAAFPPFGVCVDGH